MSLVPATLPHLDANELSFFARQLEYLVPKVYEKKYANLKARQHFPVSFEGGPGAESITYRFYDRVGRAQIGLNFPRVNVKGTEHTVKVKSLTDSYGYNFQELRYAIQSGLNLDGQMAMAARRAIAELEDNLAYLGDDDAGIVGAFTHPNIPIQIAANPISAASTSDQIIAVINSAINAMVELSNGVESADMVLLPIDSYNYINSTPRATGTDTSILKFIKDSHPGVTFDWCTRCTGAGTNGTDIMYVYKRNEDNMVLRIPSDFEQLPVFFDGVEYKVGCHERFAGIQMFYATAIVVEGV